MPTIKNKTICDFTCKAEKIIEKTLLRKIFNTKNTLKDRVFMYIFLFFSVSLGMGIIGANAYYEQQLIKNNIIGIENTKILKLVIDN